MLRRLLPIAAAGLALALSAGCADDVSPAAEINGVKISDDALLDEVAQIAGNDQFVDPAQLEGSPPGTYPQELVAAVLQRRLVMELLAQEFAEMGLELTDELRAQTIDLVAGGDQAGFEAFLGQFSDDYADTFIDDVTHQIAVEDALGAGFDLWQTQALVDAEIEVSPRYGSWDAAAGQIVGPQGPAVPPTPTVPASDAPIP